MGVLTSGEGLHFGAPQVQFLPSDCNGVHFSDKESATQDTKSCKEGPLRPAGVVVCSLANPATVLHPRHRHPSLDTLAATCPSGTPPSPTFTCRSPHGGKKSRPSPTRISPPRARRPRRRPPRPPPRRRRGWRRCPPSPAAASPRRPKGKRRLWSLVSCRARPQQRALA